MDKKEWSKKLLEQNDSNKEERLDCTKEIEDYIEKVILKEDKNIN